MNKLLIILILAVAVARCDVNVNETLSFIKRGDRKLSSKLQKSHQKAHPPAKPLRTQDKGFFSSNPWNVPLGPENNSFAKQIHDMMRKHPIRINPNLMTTLRCEYNAVAQITDYNISSTIEVRIKQINEYGFHTKSVCAYDYMNRCRSHAHLGFSFFSAFLLFFVFDFFSL
jgi:hypothetical protein